MSEIHVVYPTDPNDSTRRSKFDAKFQAPVSVAAGHSEIHGGSAFLADHVDVAMADTEDIVLAFKTAAGTKRAHFVMEFSTLAGGYLELIEGPTWDASSGSLITIFNRLRLATMTSSMLLQDNGGTFQPTNQMLLDPTNFAGGAVLHDLYGWGSKNRFSGSARELLEWVLKPDTTYGIRFTATDNANAAQVILNWYEHTDE